LHFLFWGTLGGDEIRGARVPPNRRAMPSLPWLKAPQIRSSCSEGMPTPVSRTCATKRVRASESLLHNHVALQAVPFCHSQSNIVASTLRTDSNSPPIWSGVAVPINRQGPGKSGRFERSQVLRHEVLREVPISERNFLRLPPLLQSRLAPALAAQARDGRRLQWSRSR
jgi:hypothetical protein